MKKRYKLTIDVTFDHVKDGDEQELELNLNFVASHAMGEGLLTAGLEHVEVDQHIVRLTELEARKASVRKRVGDLELLDDGNIQGTVRMNIADLTEHESVLEKYLDVISDKLTGTDLLSDLKDQIVDIEDGSVLVIEVEGSPEFLHDCGELTGPIKELLNEG